MLALDEVTGVIQTLELHTPFNALPDWPARPFAYPGSIVPIIVPDQPTNATWRQPNRATLRTTELRWGFEAPWSPGKLLFNTRIETALGPNPGISRTPIEQGRCVVPTYGFFEPHTTETIISPQSGRKIKRQYRFDSPNKITLLAGIHDGSDFSVVTTAPNATVAPIHDRMPLVLDPSEVDTWLYGNPASLADRSSTQLHSAPEEPFRQGMLPLN